MLFDDPIRYRNWLAMVLGMTTQQLTDVLGNDKKVNVALYLNQFLRQNGYHAPVERKRKLLLASGSLRRMVKSSDDTTTV